MRNRSAAFLKHLAISAAALAPVVLAARFIWYPAPYFQIMDAGRHELLLVGLTLGLGPVLTWVVFRPGKKGLKFDLVVIALLQAAVFLYGTYRLYDARPLYMVFAVDRFNILLPGDVDAAELRGGRFESRPVAGPLLVVATLPDDPKEREQLMVETLFHGLPDVDRRPRYWSHYRERADAVLGSAGPLQRLGDERPAAAEAIEKFAVRSGRPVAELVFLGVTGPRSDYAVILDRGDGAIIGAIEADPWLE